MKNENKNKKKWGDVNSSPGKEASSIRNAKENAERTGAKGHVKSTNMDPTEGESQQGGRSDDEWQQLDRKEKKHVAGRKDGWPKNTGSAHKEE